MAEFATKNQFSETIKATPFMANYGFHPHFTVELHPQIQKKKNTEATSMTTKLVETHEWLKAEITYAQERQEEYTNVLRLTALRFIPGYKVWLPSKHIITKRLSRKVDNKRLGPFEVLKAVTTLGARTPASQSLSFSSL